MLLRIMWRWKSCLKMIKANKPEPLDHVSLSDEESTDAKKELDDIDNKFD